MVTLNQSRRWFIPDHGREMQTLLDQLSKHSAREAAIVGHALVEATLEAALGEIFTPGYDSRMFKDGILSNFLGKVQIAEAIGLAPKSFTSNLHTINTIRNKFAHIAVDMTFDSQLRDMNVGKLCKSLTMHVDFKHIIEELNTKSGGTLEKVDKESYGLILEDRFSFLESRSLFSDQDLLTSFGLYITNIKLLWLVLTLQMNAIRFNREQVVKFLTSE